MVMGKKSRKADGARCRRHPRHRQGAGVCPICLRERLSHLSPSASLPSVVRGGKDSEEASSCSEASTEGSSAESSASGSASPWAAAFYQEMRRGGGGGGGGARLSLLMRHERVVVNGDEVVGVARRTSFWAKLLHATRGGGGKKDGCSLAHSKTLEAERSTAAKWILF